jgi:hypothetical protein
MNAALRGSTFVILVTGTMEPCSRAVCSQKTLAEYIKDIRVNADLCMSAVAMMGFEDGFRTSRLLRADFRGRQMWQAPCATLDAVMSIPCTCSGHDQLLYTRNWRKHASSMLSLTAHGRPDLIICNLQQLPYQFDHATSDQLLLDPKSEAHWPRSRPLIQAHGEKYTKFRPAQWSHKTAVRI